MKTFDAHCDTLCRILDEGETLENNTFHIDLKRLGENHTQIFACFISPEYSKEALDRFLELAHIFHKNGERGILSIENGDLITSLSVITMLKKMGVRIIAPVWNFPNHLAEGVLGNPEKGLTEFGKRVILELNKENILIDYSHMNDKSFFDSAKISSAPIIATHSNSRKICSNPRNLTDEQFKMIIKTQGCTGINFYPPLLSDRPTAGICDILNHIEHFLSLGGEDNIGFGSDFDGVDALPEGIGDCRDTYKIINKMGRIGYSDALIEKIYYKKTVC